MITRSLLVLALASASLSAAANAYSQPAPPTFEATFTQHFTDRQRGDAGPWYPMTAAQHGIVGDAVIQCHAMPGGILRGCQIASEAPAGLSFGVAALRMAARGAIVVSPPKPLPSGALVLVHVPFRLGR